MKAVGIVPARLESQRLPGKALIDICGLPMVVHTCKRALKAETLSDVFLATDSEEIKKIAEKFDIKVIMTSKKHKNSSERAAEAAKSLDADIIVNIQGDEPLLYPKHIDLITKPILMDEKIDVCMGVSKFYKKNSFSDLKAVLDSSNNIIYSSRADIPHHYLKEKYFFWRMCFIVPHKKNVLEKYLEWHPTPLEVIEDNHFLRLIENGVNIKAIEIEGAQISVDTLEDLNEVKQLMNQDFLYKEYQNEI